MLSTSADLDGSVVQLTKKARCSGHTHKKSGQKCNGAPKDEVSCGALKYSTTVNEQGKLRRVVLRNMKPNIKLWHI